MDNCTVQHVERKRSTSHETARWFHRSISGYEAEQLLKATGKIGSFLVRNSCSKPGHLVLSALTETLNVVHMWRESEVRQFTVGHHVFQDFASFVEFYLRSEKFIASCHGTFRLIHPVNSTVFRARDIAQRVVELREHGCHGFREEYELLQKERFFRKFSREEGTKAENKAKNRFPNILPDDETRVVLKHKDVIVPGEDYINASYVQGLVNRNKPSKGYIAAQTCLLNTINSFWWMVYQEKCQIIVMVGNERKKNKRLQYWPGNGCIVKYGSVIVQSVSEEEAKDIENGAEWIIRKFEIVHEQQPQKPEVIYQYTFLSWPDHGVPSDPRGFRNFIHRVRAHQDKNDFRGPLLVHCCSGIGQTGISVVADMIISKILSHGFDCDVDICSTILAARKGRPGSIQTQCQYEFLYNIILSLVEERTI